MPNDKVEDALPDTKEPVATWVHAEDFRTTEAGIRDFYRKSSFRKETVGVEFTDETGERRTILVDCPEPDPIDFLPP